MANGPAPAESTEAVPAPKTKAFPSPSPAAAATKGRGLRRWRRIRRDQERPRDSTGGGGEGEADSHLHKRWLPLLGAPRGKRDASAAAADAEAESSTASVESRIVLVPPPASPGPGLGFSVGVAGSGNSADRGSRSSTAASAPRVPLPRCGHASVALAAWNHRAAQQRSGCSAAAAASVSTEPDCSRSSVESDLRSSNAGNARQLGHRKGSASSVVGRSTLFSVGKGDSGRMHSGAHPWSESVLMLQRAQEALENEVEKITAMGKEPSDEFDVSDDEWTGSVHLQEPNQNLMVRIKHLESRLQEASALIKEKASRTYELEAIHGQMQPGKTTRECTNMLLSQCELDQLYRERMESEVQCIILTRAYQASAILAEDQMILYHMQKSVSEDYKVLELKLRHTESRAMVLEEMAEKLQLQCEDLSNSSEALLLRYNVTRVSLLCFVQFLLLCIAMGTYLMRLSPSSTKVVPT